MAAYASFSLSLYASAVPGAAPSARTRQGARISLPSLAISAPGAVGACCPRIGTAIGARAGSLSARALPSRAQARDEVGAWALQPANKTAAACAEDGGDGDGSETRDRSRELAMVVGLAAALALGLPEHVWAEAIDPFFAFNPVCPAADGVFRAGQSTALAIAGDKNIENYRPLINDVLIRVRTELCVLESFSRETAVPFIREKGVGWVLPVHETSETYLAGVVFMVGTNFILLGSTKVIAILSIYHDLALGLPARVLGKVLGFADSNPSEKAAKELDALMEKQMAEVREVMKGAKDPSAVSEQIAAVNAQYQSRIETLKSEQVAAEASRRDAPVGKALSVAAAAAVPFRLYGRGSQVARNVLEVFDTFCSRYFVTFTVAYILVKTAHFLVFPDFP